MPKYRYWQQTGGEETWKPWPASELEKLLESKHPAFITALAVSHLADDLPAEERDKLKYAGPLYFDWDGEDLVAVAEQVEKLCLILREKGLDLGCVSLYATGGRGFHLEIPQACFMAKVPKDGVQYLPVIYKQLAFELAVDYLDFRVYSGGRGRMWRTCGVLRDNGHYKVPITFEELQNITVESYAALTKEPRLSVVPHKPELCMDLLVMYDKAAQTVTERLKKRKKKNTDTSVLKKQSLPSLEALLEGRGIKDGTGFHQIALQLAIVAESMGWTDQQLADKAAGLAENHQSDSGRYSTPGKRRAELIRMHRYIDGNPCYDFSVGALKSLLNHEAPDLDGIPVSQEDVDANIKQANEEPKVVTEATLDEYEDVASAVKLSKYGVYAHTDEGSKRICAVSFQDVHILRSPHTGQVSCYEADVLINGKSQGRQTLELDIFGGLQAFNKFASRHSHALQGSDQHVRGLMMRVAEKGRKEGKTYFVLNREGLDIINIINHEDPEMREPFMVWADNKGVTVEPRIAAKGYEFSFQGFPDPRGVFRTDISDAPKLVDWIEEPGNKETLHRVVENLITCQQPGYVAKLVGWYMASFYRMLFHKAYNQFPILHVNGAAGAGKCLHPETKLLRADGSIVLAKDVKKGDQLLGPDSKPRNVLSTCTGREMMYRVTPVKGESYTVNASHILSLKKSGYSGAVLDGVTVPVGYGVVNMNVELYAKNQARASKVLKGWRAESMEFNRPAEDLLLDSYWLGCWLGDGNSDSPSICKPEQTKMVQALLAHALAKGHRLQKYAYREGECPRWAFSTSDSTRTANGYLDALRAYGLLNNKHIPDAYLKGPRGERLWVLAGLLDSDGSETHGGYDWVSKSERLADDFVFLCRSLGLAAYKKTCRKGVKSTSFVGDYFRVSVSGDCSVIPCLDKPAQPRKQCKDVLSTGITAEAIGEGDYAGFELDGDHLFLLADFTVTHNTQMSRLMLSLFYFNQDPKVLTPGSTLFALQQHMAGSASIPMVLDEYKPHEMPQELHGKLKLMIRDAYNCRDVTRGGGTRDSDDYRSLYSTQLGAPMVVIAEAAEQEAAVMERVVLCTMVRPPASVAMKWSTRFHLAYRDRKALSVLGQYIATDVVMDYSTTKLTEEFDALLKEAQDTYMLSEKDLKSGLSDDELRAKQGAKERTVFNYTVTRFGLRKFRQLMKDIFENEFEEKFAELEATVYDRMADLLPSTQAEWVKVLNMVATMSVSVDSNSPVAIRKGFEYELITYKGKSALELSARSSYHKYRAYCRSISERPLFPGDQAFLHGLKDCSALLHQGPGEKLAVPGGSFIFDLDELARMGVEPFKER